MMDFSQLSFPGPEIVVGISVMVGLIFLSAIISGSEVALFSLSKLDREELEKENTTQSLRVVTLLKRPKRLLATILIANNFINVAIVIITSFILGGFLDSYPISENVVFFLEVIFITFIILLFGEVLPKVYANKNRISFAKKISYFIFLINKLLTPLSKLLVSSSGLIDKRIKKKAENISVDDLEHALDLTKEDVETDEEKKILEGIVKFGQTDAKQIMTSRMDIKAISSKVTFVELKEKVLEAKFSRVPIFDDSVDKIKGILYIKDLLGNFSKDEFEDWVDLVRPCKFITENKKLDDLLKEFQEEKTHVAIVVDEYGGTSGLISLEDVLEEVVGDITDEFDDDDLIYSKIDDNTYVFEGKTPLMDMYRVLDIEGDEFEAEKGESDTIAGFCIEQAGKILMKNEKVVFGRYTFIIESSDKRRIKQVKVSVQRNQTGA